MNELNIKSSTIEKGLDLAKNFLERVTGPAIDEVGLLLADNVRIWRWKNQIKILGSAERYAEKHNISLKKIPIKLLVPLLENASLEENENLQEKWRNLLINYVDSTKSFSSSVYPYLLSQLSSNEVALLWKLSTSLVNLNRADSKIPDGTDFSHQEFYISDIKIKKDEISNLQRLGLIFEEEKIVNTKIDSAKVSSNEILPSRLINYELIKTGNIKLTILGKHFVEACSLEE